MNNNQWDGQEDISRFLEKFNQEIPTQQTDVSDVSVTAAADPSAFARQEEYRASFEKLEAKIQELESKFAISAAQNQAVLQELTQTRRAVESQKSRDAVLLNITSTVAQLKASVENLSHLHQATAYQTSGANFDITTPVAPATANEYSSSYKPDYVRAQAAAQVQAARKETQQAQAALQTERKEKTKILQSWTQDREKQKRELALIQKNATEKTRVISALQQKASQLKAVNVALDREIKRVHQERLEALRKSAEQAKEILFLRDELSAAEERFKSFDFEGRIISVKQEYEQKVTTLETQLHEITNTCMKQVEEIEWLKTENQKLQKIAAEKEELTALYTEKTKELEILQETVAQLRAESDEQPARLAAFTQRIQRLQTEQAALEERLETTQQLLQSVTDEKHTLEQNFQDLVAKIKQNDTVIESLKGKIAVLTQENQELKSTQTTQNTRPTVTPREPVAVRQPVFRLRPRFAAHAKEEITTRTSSAPVEVQQSVRSNVRSEADLPEIRVAHIPQEELYNGEDFLERTDSFIGRMKWSIFRDEK